MAASGAERARCGWSVRSTELPGPRGNGQPARAGRVPGPGANGRSADQTAAIDEHPEPRPGRFVLLLSEMQKCPTSSRVRRCGASAPAVKDTAFAARFARPAVTAAGWRGKPALTRTSSKPRSARRTDAFGHTESTPERCQAKHPRRTSHARRSNPPRLAITPDGDRIVGDPPSHRPIRVKAARSFPASIRNIRMANHHTQNSLSRRLKPRTDVTGRSAGAALRPVADDVAPTQAEISLDRRPSAHARLTAGSSAPFNTWCVAAPAQSRKLTTQRHEHDQPTGVSQRQWAGPGHDRRACASSRSRNPRGLVGGGCGDPQADPRSRDRTLQTTRAQC